MLRAGCEQRFIDVANWILGATWNAKGLGVNTTREEGVQPLREGRKPRENATRKILLYRSSPLLSKKKQKLVRCVSSTLEVSK